MKWFCKHKWKILQDITTESWLEHTKKLGLNPLSALTFHYFERKYITIVVCEHCGKLKRFVENI